MAQAIDFEERNDYIGKPADITDNQCYALPVARIITTIPGPTSDDAPANVAAHVSCWELTEDELEEVKKTGKVYVKILGSTLAPMSLHGSLPIIKTGDYPDTHFTKEEIEYAKKNFVG